MKFATCPARLGKRDLPSIWDVQAAMVAAGPIAEEPSAPNAAATATAATPSSKTLSPEVKTISLPDNYDGMMSWPRRRKLCTMNDESMSLAEVGKALQSASVDLCALELLVKEEEQEASQEEADAESFIESVFGSAVDSKVDGELKPMSAPQVAAIKSEGEHVDGDGELDAMALLDSLVAGEAGVEKQHELDANELLKTLDPELHSWREEESWITDCSLSTSDASPTSSCSYSSSEPLTPPDCHAFEIHAVERAAQSVHLSNHKLKTRPKLSEQQLALQQLTLQFEQGLAVPLGAISCQNFSVQQVPPAVTPSQKRLTAAARNGAERKEWTTQEDETIRTSVLTYGCRWRKIATMLPGRSDDAVRNRWSRLKETMPGDLPTPQPAKRTNGEEKEKSGSKVERVSWSRAEDTIILSSVQELGHKWNQIQARLPGRTDHAIRNRFHRLQTIMCDQQLQQQMVLAPPVGLPIAHVVSLHK